MFYLKKAKDIELIFELIQSFNFKLLIQVDQIEFARLALLRIVHLLLKKLLNQLILVEQLLILVDSDDQIEVRTRLIDDRLHSVLEDLHAV